MRESVRLHKNYLLKKINAIRSPSWQACSAYQTNHAAQASSPLTTSVRVFRDQPLDIQHQTWNLTIRVSPVP